MDKYDTSQLTEFPRFEPEPSPSGVSTFFNKLRKLPLFTPSEGTQNPQITPDDEKKQVEGDDGEGRRESEDNKTETGVYAVELEVRTLPNVLRRISSLIALGSRSGTRYADTELARYWMPDDISRECYECAVRFSTLRRRHHCRVCGQIFCSRCCSQRVPGHIFGCAGGLRVCNYCCNVVLSYLKENDLNGEISPDLRTLQESLQVKFPENKTDLSSSREKFVFSHDQDVCNSTRAVSEELPDIYRQLAFTLPTHQHRYRLVRYSGVWRGADILQWVMDNTSNKTRVQAHSVCQSLVTNGYMECVTEISHFADYALYKPSGLNDDCLSPDCDEPEESPRIVESVSSYCLDLNLGDSSARLIKTPKTDVEDSISTQNDDDEPPVIDHSEEEVEPKQVNSGISAWGAEHLRVLTRQMLAARALPPAWLDVLLPLAMQAAHVIQPECDSNDIDIRNYVQVKKVPGGTPRDSCLIRGVVLTKNVAHRGMPQQISNPTILLLDCSIAYQRVEGKLTSLEPVLLQEHEYLSRCGARLSALNARVILARGGAGRAVCAAARGAGAALALRVRGPALRRAARCARADLVASLDARIGAPRLGTADNFYVKDFGSKTLMVLEGCANPHLGCCILLRGASLPELVRVKKVVKFMLLACYNWKLEKAFYADIEAVLPEPGMAFDDEQDFLSDDKNDKTNGETTNDDPKIDKTNDNQKEDKVCDGHGDGITNDDQKDTKNSEHLKDSIVYDHQIDLKTNNRQSDVKTNDDQSVVGTNDDQQAKTNAEKTNDDQQPKPNAEKTNDDQQAKTNAKKANDDQQAKTNAEKTNDNQQAKTNADKTNDNQQTKSNAVKTNDYQQAKPNTEKTNEDKNEVSDPLQKPKYSRKTENLSCGVPIRDFSDPLRATLSVDDDVFLKGEETLVADTQTERFRWSADDVVLSVSPSVVVPPPYIETETGRRCPLRALFPSPCVRKRAPRPSPTTRAPRLDTAQPHTTQEYHPFLKMAMKSTAEDPIVKAALAHFRATGSRIDDKLHDKSCPLYKPEAVLTPTKPPEPATRDEPLDPFAPENHQKLHVLLYSYCAKSPNVPDFCVNPWVVTMETYGRHDITLGAFLDKYCFNAQQPCSSDSCHIPINQHIRKFVHNDVCITVTCNTIGHSNVDKLKEEQSKHIMFWSRCDVCGATGGARRLSRAALALSLAQYVRARAGGAGGLRARCPHRLHAALHAFTRHLTTAAFTYSKISHCDIMMPPHVISTNYDTKQMRDSLIAQLNELMLKGHEVFSNAGVDAEREQSSFKQHMDSLHVALSSPALRDSSTDVVIRSLWSISDGIIMGEKMVRDAQEKWATPPAPAPAPPPASFKTVDEKSDLEDTASDGSNSDGASTTYVFTDNTGKEIDKEHSGPDEDEEKGDKKTIRQIVTQLLSSNHSANQAGMVVCGLVCVCVYAHETGSVIACALAAPHARRQARIKHSSIAEFEEMDNNATYKDKTDGDKSKAAKSSEHVEVMLKDGLVCRIYYAAQFSALRHAVIAPLSADEECCCDGDKKLCSIEEGYIRSLAHCVPWATRGGKSGSTFCKTTDDRYVLKEMTKPEWQQFLEFAPHYFQYVTTCRQNNTPTLLARMVGVYSVGGTGGAGGGVLVLENVWYGCDPHQRYDLKGSSRHRLAPPLLPAPASTTHGVDAPPTYNVLMDENLLNLRWERPLYIRSHVSRALHACLARDTAFLTRHAVMDYSLLLAIHGNTLVLGIIDYIRTFTWDKKLEHLVKKNLGSGMPTVVSPAQYKARFIHAARKYFLQCPEPWDHLYDVLPTNDMHDTDQ